MIYTLKIFEGVYIYVSSVIIFFYTKKLDGNMPQAAIYTKFRQFLTMLSAYNILIQIESSHFSSGSSYRYIVNISQHFESICAVI